MADREFFIIHETTLQSWLRDLGTFVWVSALIGLGWLLESSAMQWFGAVVAFLILLNRTTRAAHRCDATAAKALLDKIERGDR